MKKRLISLALVLNVMFNMAGCSTSKKEDTGSNSTSITDSKRDISIDKIIQNIEKEKIPYSYEEYYPTKDFIKNFKSKLPLTTTGKHEDDDYTTIFDCIEQNTKEMYGELNGIFMCQNVNYPKEELERVKKDGRYVQIALKQALDSIFINATNDIKDDICQLKATSIVISDLSDAVPGNKIYGIWYSKIRTIAIDYDAIKQEVLNKTRLSEDSDAFEKELISSLKEVIEHEIGHDRICMCECNSEWPLENYMTGLWNQRSFTDEAIAQGKFLYDNYYKKNLDLPNQMYHIEMCFDMLILLQSVFKENRNIDQYFNTVLDNDIYEYWDFFDLNNNEDLEEFYKILYSVDTLLDHTNLSQTINENVSNVDEIQKKVGYSYLIEIFKDSIIDLINEIQKNDFKLDDSLMLYLFLKSYIVDFLYAGSIEFENDNSYTVKFDNEFASKILIIEDEFTKYLSGKYKISNDQLKSQLNGEALGNRLTEFNEFANNNSKNASFEMLLKKYPLMKYMMWINQAKCDYYYTFNEYVEDNKQLIKKS